MVFKTTFSANDVLTATDMNNIWNFIGVPYTEWNTGASINLNGTSANTAEPSPSPSGMQWMELNCLPNDIFYINVVPGSNAARSYAFIDLNNKILERGEKNVAITNSIIVAPKDTAKVIFNDKPNQDHNTLILKLSNLINILNKRNPMPMLPTTEGNYKLNCTIDNGVFVYSWVAET